LAASAGSGCASASRRAPSARPAVADEQDSSAPPADGLAAPGAAVPPWTWVVTLRGGGDVDVGSVDVRLCFRDRPPAHVGPENVAALPFLVDLPHRTDAAGRAADVLAVDDVGIVTAHLPPGACIAFSVDLEDAARRLQRIDLAMRFGRSVIASPDVWLWRPRPWPAGAEGALWIDVGDDAVGAGVALPLPRARGGTGDDAGLAWRVPGSTFALQSYAAFGTLATRAFDHRGARFVVVRVGDGGVDDATLRGWLEVAADDVAVPLGRFPNDEVLVLAAPLAGRRPIHSGFLGRGGGRPTALILLGKGPFDADDDPELVDDDGRWVLTHELAHALLPPVVRRDAWFNEGLTTWQQEVLPLRAGRRAADVVRGQLAVGLRTGQARARADGVSLERACAEMDSLGSYQHCYWGGAALAALLAVDVGTDAVDALVAALHAAGPIDGAPRGALALLEAVASGDDADARRAALRLRELWQKFRGAPFPDVEALAIAGASPPAPGSG
jgi:hypothetical protein